MAVGDVVFLISDLCTNHHRAVVKMHREGKRLDTGGGSEDSDCESGSEHAGGSTPEAQEDEKERTAPDSLPVLTTGSFSRYVHCK